MAFKCACFISYPHNAGKSVDTFVNRLKLELADRLAQFITAPIRTDHDFAVGAGFNKAIAEAICQSACLIVVYMPVYQRKLFCLQEYTAMEQLQAARYNALQKDLSAQYGMILPLIYAGDESKIPKWISEKINYKNIGKFTTAGPEAVFDEQDFKEWLMRVANDVDSLYNEFDAAPANPCDTCGKFVLPDPEDAEVTCKLNIPNKPTESFR